jgi:hypothetical protein
MRKFACPPTLLALTLLCVLSVLLLGPFLRPTLPQTYPAPDATNRVNTGGSLSAFIPANNGATFVVKNAPGRLMKVTVTATGTAAATFYDNASAASGNKLLVVPANAAAGTIYDLQCVAVSGITCDALANCPALSVYYE